MLERQSQRRNMEKAELEREWEIHKTAVGKIAMV